MSAPKFQPDGIDQIRQASREVDAAEERLSRAEAKLVEAQKVVEAAKEEKATAYARLHALVTQGQCDHGPTPKSKASDDSPVQKLRPVTPEPDDVEGSIPALDDRRTSIVWRIGFHLWRNPIIDYQYVAERVYGPGLDTATAKNRVASHLTQLRREGVATPRGGNRYDIDPEMLAKKSGIPVPTRRPQTES